jgi:hypothetical protein
MKPNKSDLFLKSITKSSDEAIIGMLTELRESGEDYMTPILIELLFSERSEKLKEEVVNFLVDLKNKSSVEIIAKSLNEHKHSKDIHRLVSVCWQSRLDFTPHIDLFIEILAEGDYQASLEAFTTIENMTENLSSDKVKEVGNKIKSLHAKHPNTQPLIDELVRVFEDL